MGKAGGEASELGCWESEGWVPDVRLLEMAVPPCNP